MSDYLRGARKFCCWACIIWLICIFVAYRGDFSGSARSVTVIIIVGGFPMIIFLLSIARNKYQACHRHRQRNDTHQSSMITPEPRERLHTNLSCNSSIEYFLVTYMHRSTGRAEENGCVVCLGQLQHGDMVVKIEACSHVFHEECIDRWLRLHMTCPICRSQVDGKAAEESIVGHITTV